jgi:universal stress protein A
MFKKILLPVDLADRHDAALEVAAKMAAQSKGTVTLLHVIETISDMSTGEEREFYSQLETTARSALKRLGKHLDGHKVPWQAEILFGHRAAATIRHAAAMAADLIILTAPRIDPANPTANWGSLSFKISVLSQCPVLMVR